MPQQLHMLFAMRALSLTHACARKHACAGTHPQGADWNDYYGVKEIVTPPYDSDGLLGFSDDEARDIITIWRGVAEHFSAWEVDVTTEDPGFDGIERCACWFVTVCWGSLGAACVTGAALLPLVQERHVG